MEEIDTERFSTVVAGFFLAWDNSDPPRLWVWRGEPGDETSEPWVMVASSKELRKSVIKESLTTAEDSDTCECHERDGSFVCESCYKKGLRGHMQQ